MTEDDIRNKFTEITREITENGISRVGIGTYKEKTTHHILKSFFDPDESHHEIPCGAYVADIMNEDGITEIQTSGFATIRDRLEFFSTDHNVTVVYPVIAGKRLVWIDPADGSVTEPKKSPKKGNVLQILPELYGISGLFGRPTLRFRVVLLEATEYRVMDGWGNGGKRGSHKRETIPTGLVDIVDIATSDDISALIPFSGTDKFTSKEFAKACGFSWKSTRDTGMALKFLVNTGIIEKAGKKGNAYLYVKK